MVNRNNAEGHKERFRWLKSRIAPEELKAKFVGGAVKDIHRIGYQERVVLERYAKLPDASVIDVGCGIGRLTRYLLPLGLRSYLGTDVVPEIIDEARQVADENPNYRFEIVDGPTIPAEAKSADVVCGFSVITHLLDEEVFRLFLHSNRVLKPGGVAIYSYLEFTTHRGLFLQNNKSYEDKPDILKFFWPGTMEFFAGESGFDVLEVISGKTPIRGTGEMLQNGEQAPAEFPFGQSIIAMRKRA